VRLFFFIDIAKTSECKVGARVQLRFSVSQRTRDAELLKNLMVYLGCVNVILELPYPPLFERGPLALVLLSHYYRA
jgi:hypothetical protein